MLILVLLLGLAASVPVSAQVPTAEQLELLRTMSPEDREALLSQLGLDGAVIDQGSAPGASGDSNRNARDAEAQRNRFGELEEGRTPGARKAPQA
jgi:hypothetical protein